MSPPNIFRTEVADQTLVVVVQSSVSSFAGERVSLELETLFEEIARRKVAHVVFDLDKVSYFGSTLLAAMHAVWRHLEQDGGRMAVCNVSDVGLEILQIARFDTVWTIRPTRPEALAAVED